MDVLIATYLSWIISQTGWSAPAHPPIHFVTQTEMVRLNGSPGNTALQVQAMYSISESSIYLPEGYVGNDMRHKSALLHELVHHVQRFNNIDLPCAAAYERQAYDLQIKWLREQGVVDPYDLLKTDEFTIHLVSTCRDG